jgi:tetratricopeptide (TPR) repeat protein
MLNRSDEAMADFTRAVELDPTFADNYMCLGRLWQERGRLLRARIYFNKAAELGEPEAPIFVTLVNLQMGAADFSEGDPLRFAVETLAAADTPGRMRQKAASHQVLIDPDLLVQLAQVAEQAPAGQKGIYLQRLEWLLQIYEQRYAAPAPSKFRQFFGWVRGLFGRVV